MACTSTNAKEQNLIIVFGPMSQIRFPPFRISLPLSAFISCLHM